MADVELQSLELQITGDANGAKKSLDALIKTLDRLKTATKGGCGLSAVAIGLRQVQSSGKGVSTSNAKSAKSFANLGAKIGAAALTLKKAGQTVASWIKESNDYVENVNLFTVAMGEYADSAKQYAEEVGELMGIDPSDWMRSQGVFMTLATGFGVAGDRAATMSKQLTQLGYDISSFYNIKVEEAMQRLQSGISGELEPLRRLGYDLSQAKLEATALSLGIDKTVSSMTQAEKAQLRYYAIMTQVTTAQGDMSRTLEAPANQIRIFTAQAEQAARALGNIFIPALNAVLPYGIAFLRVIREIANGLANLFGFTLPEMDYSGLDGVASGGESASDAIDEATDSAERLKRTLLGIDELNVMTDNSSSGAGASVSGGGSFDFELPEYDFMGEISKQTDKAYKTIKKIMKPVEKLIDYLIEYKEIVLLGAGLIALTKLWGTLKSLWAWIKGIQVVKSFLIGWDVFRNTGATVLQSIKGGFESVRMSLTGLQKGLIVAVAAFAEFSVVKTNVREIALGCEDVGLKIAEMGVVAGVAAAAMYVALGPAGLALAAVVAITAAVAGFGEAQETMRKQIVDAAFFDGVGVSIEELGRKLEQLTEQLGVQNGQIVEWQEQIESNNDTIAETGLSIENLTATMGSAGVITQDEVNKLKTKFSELYESVRMNMTLSEEVITTALVGAMKRATPEISAAIDTLIGEYYRYVRETQGRAEELRLMIDNGYDQLVGKQKDDPAYQQIMDNINGWYMELGYLSGGMSDAGWQWQQTVGAFNSNEIDFGDDVKSAQTALDNIASIGQTALEEVASARDAVLKQIDEEIAYASKYKTEDLELLFDIRETLEKDYAEQESAIKNELNTIFDSVQKGMIGKISDTKTELELNWDNMNVFEKWWNDFNEEKYVRRGLVDMQGKIDTISGTIQGHMNELKTDGSVWADDAMRGIIESLFSYDRSHSDLSGLGTTRYSYKMELEDAIEEVLGELGVDMAPVAKETGAGVAGSVGAGMASHDLRSWVDSMIEKSMNPYDGYQFGYSFGQNMGSGVVNAIKNTKLPTITGNVTTTSSGTPRMTFSAYASGGFPADGEMFVAREAGPELVGTIGNRSAVVNNDQIVESVSKGVYQAVSSAMGDSQGNQVVEAKVNDKVLFEVVVSRARRESMRTGHNPLLGGV